MKQIQTILAELNSKQSQQQPQLKSQEQQQQSQEQQQDQNLNQKRDKLLFLLDIFILSIVVLSGCAILLGNLNIAATSRKLRMEIFAESMQILCEHLHWKDNETRVCVFVSFFKSVIIIIFTIKI